MTSRRARRRSGWPGRAARRWTRTGSAPTSTRRTRPGCRWPRATTGCGGAPGGRPACRSPSSSHASPSPGASDRPQGVRAVYGSPVLGRCALRGHRGRWSWPASPAVAATTTTMPRPGEPADGGRRRHHRRETGQFALAATITGLEGTDGPVDVSADGSFSFPDRLVAARPICPACSPPCATRSGCPGFVDNLFDDPIDMVSDGEFLYLDFPLLADTVGGSDWVKVDASVIGWWRLHRRLRPVAARALPRRRYRVHRGGRVGASAGRRSPTTRARSRSTPPWPPRRPSERERLEAAIDGLGVDADGRSTPIPFEA